MSGLKTEIFRFGVVGTCGTIVNYVVYLLCAKIMPLHLASASGYCAGLIISYVFGAIWVFANRDSGKKHIAKKTAVKFVLVYAVGGFGMSLIIEGLYRYCGFDYRLCWLAGASFAIVNNFLGSKFFVLYSDDSFKNATT
jgi:putative flippase GtrA